MRGTTENLIGAKLYGECSTRLNFRLLTVWVVCWLQCGSVLLGTNRTPTPTCMHTQPKKEKETSFQILFCAYNHHNKLLSYICKFWLMWNLQMPKILCLVGRGSKIHRLHLCRGVRPPPNECPGYDTKQSDSEVPVMLGSWGIQSTPSLPLLLGPLWPSVVAPDRALSMG